METKSFEQVLTEDGVLYWKNVGSSMQPLIREGKDIIKIIKKNPSQRCKKYDAVLFKRPGIKGRGEYVLHRILKVKNDGTYYIAGDNCYKGEIVSEENIIGILKAVIRDNRTLTTQDSSYKIYVRLWCDFYYLRFFIIRIKSIILNKLYRIYSKFKRKR